MTTTESLSATNTFKTPSTTAAEIFFDSPEGEILLDNQIDSEIQLESFTLEIENGVIDYTPVSVILSVLIFIVLIFDVLKIYLNRKPENQR